MISSICFMWLSDKAFLYTMEIRRKVTVYASSSFHISFQREDLHLENNFPSSKTKIFWGNMLGGPKKRELEKSTESCWLIINYKSQAVAQKLYFFYMTFGKQALSLTPASPIIGVFYRNWRIWKNLTICLQFQYFLRKSSDFRLYLFKYKYSGGHD